MKIWDNTREIPEPYKFISVLWLSFLVAGIATGIFFAIFNPDELQLCTGLSVSNRITAYSTGFFIFWLLTASSSLLAAYFINSKN